MHKRTDLAADTISGSDRLVVQLIEAADLPPIVAISWPVGRLCVTRTGSPTQPATVARLMARASTELARIKSGL